MSHRHIEQLRLEGTSQPQPPSMCWVPPAQAAQGPSMASDTSRDGAPQLWAVPAPHRPLREGFLPNIYPKPPLFYFKAILPCSTSIRSWKTSSLRSPSLLEGRSEVSPQPSLLQAEHPQLPQPFSTESCSSPLTSSWPRSHSSHLHTSKQFPKSSQLALLHSGVAWLSLPPF